MHTATLENLFECQMKSLNDLAQAMAERDDILVAHYKVEAACEFEILATNCLSSFDSLTGPYLQSKLSHLVNNANVDPFPVVEKLISLLEENRVGLQACIRLADIASSWEHALSCAGRLLSALSMLDGKITDIRDNWPVLNHEIAEISRRNHESGNAKDAEDVFHALQTQDS